MKLFKLGALKELQKLIVIGLFEEIEIVVVTSAREGHVEFELFERHDLY